MGKTNFTFVSPLRAALLMLVTFGLAGFNTVMAQCVVVPDVTIGTVTTSSIEVEVESGDLDPQHTFRITLFKDGDGDPTTDDFQFYGERIGVAAGTYTFGVNEINAIEEGPLPCNSRYRVRVREYCDDLSGNSGWNPFPGESFNGNATGAGENPPTRGIEVYTYSTMYDGSDFVTQTADQLPTCPGACDGEATLRINATLECCADATFAVTIEQNGVVIYDEVDLDPNTNYTVTGVCDGDVFGPLTVTVTETSGCSLETNPTTQVLPVGAGVDIEDPLYYVVDIYGVVVASNDADVELNFGPVIDGYTGAAFDFGDITLPEGECGRQDFFWVWGYDNCATTDDPFEGFILGQGLVDATATTDVPAGVVIPSTQADVLYENVPGTPARVDVHWSAGQSTVTITGFDLNGNDVDITLNANVIAAETDLDIAIAGPNQVLIPFCDTDVDVDVYVTVTGGCTSEDIISVIQNGGGITDFFFKDGVFQGFSPTFFFGGTATNEFFAQFTGLGPGDYQYQMIYTSALGNTTNVAFNFTVAQSAADQPAQINAESDSYTIPYCEDAATVFFTASVTDDCATINDADVSAVLTPDAATGLGPININGLTGQNCDGTGGYCKSYEIIPGIALPAGLHQLDISYGDITVIRFIDIDAADPQAPTVVLPGNMNVTIPPCTESVETIWSVQISDDCDDDIDAGNLTITVGGTVLDNNDTDQVSINGSVVEIYPTISPAADGAALEVSYTDSDGLTTEVSTELNVLWSPDTQAPIVVYPSQDINVELDPCDIGGTALVIFEVTAVDNCAGTLVPTVTVAGTGSVDGFIVPSPGGDTYVLVAAPGIYQILISATDGTNTTTEDFFVVVTQDPAPQDNLGCNGNLNITLGDDCTATADADLLLEGNFGCLTDADFDIVVEDGNTSNGATIDGCGVFDYTITLNAEPTTTEGFTGAFAPANWVTMTDISGGSGTNFADVQFIGNTTLQLSTDDAGSADGGDLDIDALNAMAMIDMPSAGNLSFDYQYNNGDTNFDWFVISVDGNIEASGEFASGGGTIDVDVEAGQTLLIGLDDDGCCTFTNLTTLDITNFSFTGVGVDGNFTTCWGTINVEDKEKPVIVCPEDVDSYSFGVEVIDGFAGELTNSDPTYARTQGFSVCSVSTFADDVHYDVYTFSVTEPGIYTFTANSSTDLYGNLHTSDFNPANPCDSWLAANDDSGPGLNPSISFEFTATLPVGEYSLVISTFSNTTTLGAYTIDITTPANGDVVDVVADGAFFSSLICTDLQVLRLDLPTSNIPDSYLVDADGDVISIDPALEDILDITGYPLATDNCGDIRIFVSDVFTDGGDCGDDYITRSFYAIDKMNSPCAGPSNQSLVCTQIISARKPTFDDVTVPPALVSIDCDDYSGTANPTPAQVADILNIPSGYPVVATALDALDYDGDGNVYERGFNPLNQAYCNLGASWVDLPRINVCEGTYKFVREWTLLDWCDPGNILTYRQVIKVGDYDGPEIAVPTADYNWDGILDVLEYSTSPYDCNAYFPLPDAGITDACSGAGSLTITVLAGGTTPIFVGNAGDVYAPGYPVGDHVLRYCATDGCGNETCVDVPFKVRDKVAPQAVCDDDLNVSIGGGDILNGQEGIARVFDYDIDEGSSDNCDPVEIQVRREVEGGPSYACLDAFDYDNDGVVINDEVRNEGGTWYTIWLDYVDFTCCDVDVVDGDGIVIEMRVSDDANDNGVYFETGANGDNINTCWMEIEPEDKLNPYCYPPHPVTLSCTEVPLYFPSDLQAAYNSDFAATSTMMSAVFGNAYGTDNCAVDTIVERTPSINLTDCGWGTITRRFEAWQLKPEGDVNGNGAIDGNEVRRSTNTCSQLITITEYHDYYIAFPPDAEADCGDPNIPVVVPTAIGCDILAVNTSDPERFDATGDECYKLRITHTVINWCLWNGEDDPIHINRQTGGDGFVGCTENPIVHGRGTTANTVVASIDRAHPCGDEIESNNTTIADIGYWEYVQFVKVYDSTIPEITVDAFGGPTEECPDLLPGQFGSINNVTCDAPVSITFSVDDDCELFDEDGNLVISVVDAHLDAFAFDANGDGEISTFSEFVADVNVASNITNNGDGTFTFNFVAPIIYSSQGPNIVHALRVRVEDGCGNQTSETIEFDVVDCKAPTPICINGLTVTLMPQPTGPCAMAIWASDFLASPITDCAEPIRYAIYRAADVEAAGPGFVPNQNDTGLVLTEDDDPTTIVYIYAIDAEGNFDYCETYLLVQAHNSCVPDGGGSIAGLITTEEDETVQDVEVNLSGAMVMTEVTAADGEFVFADLEAGMDYTVTPYLDANPLNGVSTFDLVLMSKHILGVDLLDSPYKMIAADVNNSQTITTLDLIQLRKLILNIDLEFSNNTSWRFVDAEYNFPVPTNPWFEAFQEVHNENDLPVDAVEIADFVAVKIGDVNLSANANLLSSDDRNVNGQFNFNVADVELKAGNEYTVEFTGADMASVAGYQLTIALEGAELVDVVYGVATEENFGMRFVNEGMITTSWNGEASADDVLFSLVVRANADAQLSEVLGVSSRYTVAEAYNNNNDLLNVGIQFNTGVVANAGFEVYQNTPNPFKGETLIGFNLPEDAQASITINDVTGRTVTVIRGDYAAGYNTVNVTRDMLNGATGVLSYTVTAGDFTATKKMIVVE